MHALDPWQRHTRHRLLPLFMLASVWLDGWFGFAAAQRARDRAEPLCRAIAPLTALPGLPEASGIALGRRDPSRLFAVTDSGQPVLVGIARSGAVETSITVANARVVDWEDVTIGRCGEGSCVYIGDIGDNSRSRESLTVYRLPEPRAGDTQVRAEAFKVAYPDGAHDAEAMFATAAGDLYIVTKENRGAALYRVPPLTPKPEPLMLIRVARSEPKVLSRITGAEASPDGVWVALRTNDDLLFFRTSELVKGQMTPAARMDVRRLGEPQGEGVSLDTSGNVYLAGEGGGKGRPGTFLNLRCSLPH